MAEVMYSGAPYSGLLPYGRNVDQKIWDGSSWNQWDTRYTSIIRPDQPPFFQRVPYLYYYQYYWQWRRA
ncbi:MAG: hypothetical protein NUV70_03950 [Caldiserica bacterium]|nr:hypothetical protein [Caldisericota bacterium]